MSSSVPDHTWVVGRQQRQSLASTITNTTPSYSSLASSSRRRSSAASAAGRSISFSPYIVILDGNEEDAEFHDTQQEQGHATTANENTSVATDDFEDAREEMSVGEHTVTEQELLAMANALQNQQLTAANEPEATNATPPNTTPRAQQAISFSPYIVVLESSESPVDSTSDDEARGWDDKKDGESSHYHDAQEAYVQVIQ